MEQKSGNYRKYTSKNPLMRKVIGGFLDDVGSLIDSTGAKTVLDAGCGEGFITCQLNDKKLVGMDISKSALGMAARNCPGVAFARGDVYNMPFKPEKFDLVMMMEVLEHLEDPEQAMAEASRFSRRYCLFSVPDEPYFAIMNLLRGKNLSRFGRDEGHINNWSERDFIKLISNNFNIISIRKPFPWTVVLCEKRYDTQGRTCEH